MCQQLMFFPRQLNHLRKAVAKQYLGTGGFADVHVYQCQQIHNETNDICNESFVVKQLRFRDIGCWNKQDMEAKYSLFQENLLHEYKIGQRICHPNVIQTLDVDTETCSLIFENVTGIDMFDYLVTNGSSNKGVELLKYFDRALCGLQHMHELGIAHMDIKLENILLDINNDQAKLIDLGQAQIFRERGEYKTSEKVCGTEEYFPPEFYNRLCFYPDKVDIWGCGVVLYNLIFDRMPWEKSSNKDPMFNNCKQYFKVNKLPPKCFDKEYYQIKELTEKDAEIIDDIFLAVFKLSPKLRIDIHELRNRLQQLSILQEQQLEQQALEK